MHTTQSHFVSIAGCSAEFRQYLDGIFKRKRLLPKTELKLILLAQDGDKAALENVVMSNMPVVIGLAWFYANTSKISLEDLVGQGTEGLLEAIKRFNQMMGGSLAAYAKSYIKRSMLRIINEQAYPVSISIDRGLRLSKSRTKVNWLNTTHISLHETTSRGYTVEETLPEEEEPQLLDTLLVKERKEVINKALSALTAEERQIIKLFNGFGAQNGMTLIQISKKLGISWYKVSETYKLGMWKLEQEMERLGMAGMEDI